VTPWPRRGNKYGAIRMTIDGITFASQHEARRYQALRVLERAGVIQDLRCQPRYTFEVNGYHVGTHRPDFDYVVCATGEVITEDAKSGPTRTEAYRLRRKLMVACHHVMVTEV
jgi:hypothetical protein